jgi:hypothetical protein
MFIDFFNSGAGQALIKALLDGISSVMGTVRQVFEEAWPAIEGVIKYFLDWFSGPDGQAVMKTLVDLLGTAMSAVQTIFEEAWPLMRKAIDAAVPLIKASLDIVIGAISLLTGNLEGAKSAWDRLWQTQQQKPINRSGAEGYQAWDGGPTIYNKGSVPNAINNIPIRENGGPIPGTGPVPITAHGGEYVLTKGDTSLMKQLTAAIVGGGMGGGPSITIEKIEIHGGRREGEEAASAFTRRLQALGVVR